MLQQKETLRLVSGGAERLTDGAKGSNPLSCYKLLVEDGLGLQHRMWQIIS